MAAARSISGVCPQFDILWGELTAREHLLLYAAIKGVTRADILLGGALDKVLDKVNGQNYDLTGLRLTDRAIASVETSIPPTSTYLQTQHISGELDYLSQCSSVDVQWGDEAAPEPRCGPPR